MTLDLPRDITSSLPKNIVNLRAIKGLSVIQSLNKLIEAIPIRSQNLQCPCERLLEPRMNMCRQIRIAIEYGSRILVITVEQRLDGAEAEAAFHGECQLRRACHKASTCLAYGYKLSQQRDEMGDRIRGQRDIDPDKAEIVRRIFRLYADGMSPRDIAQLLNNESVIGPRGKKWRDTAIRGHVRRGTGILNNESYVGRMVWNKRNYRKDPTTEKRTARANDATEWVLSYVPQMRIVSDELWSRVKDRQKEVGELFDFGQSNRLNATHRPEYLLSGMLECEECGGPYAISGKDRYSCTNRKKRLPIDELGGACCGNSKTITRHELEERVLNCIPVAFYSIDIFDRISQKMIAHEVNKLKSVPSRADQVASELAKIKTKQTSLMQQIQERHAEGRPRLAILDDQLDELEVTREKLGLELAGTAEPVEDFQEKIAKLKAQFNPANTEIAIRKLLFLARNNADEQAKRGLMPIIRDLIQTVVIGKTPGHQPATLQVHGDIANIMASMDVIGKRCLAGTLIKFRLSNVDDLTLGRTTVIHQLLS